MVLRQVITLVQKEFLIEMRQKYALSGIALYVGSSVFVIYMALSLKNASIPEYA